MIEGGTNVGTLSVCFCCAATAAAVHAMGVPKVILTKRWRAGVSLGVVRCCEVC